MACGGSLKSNVLLTHLIIPRNAWCFCGGALTLGGWARGGEEDYGLLETPEHDHTVGSTLWAKGG